MESLRSNSERLELQQMQLDERELHKKKCLAWFKKLKIHLGILYSSFDVINTRPFEIAFHIFFHEEHETFKEKMYHNLNQLQWQLERDNFHGHDSKTFLEGTTLEGCLVTEDVVMEVCLVTEGASLEASLVNKETTIFKSSSSETTFCRSENENRKSDKESSISKENDADANINPSYDSDTVIEVPHSNNDTFENVFAHGIQNHEQPEYYSFHICGSELGSELTFLAGSELELASYSSDTRPPMLDRTDFASWQQRIRLYCQDKERYNADIRATNILLQGLPKDIYSLINHYTDAKDIWDNVKMLLEGSELTKEDHKSQLYNDFEHFRQHKGEIIHDYYVRFAKLINHMRNIKMTMSRMQLNSKFVNNMLPEWGRFVTAVKLNRGLRDSNYDQLYAYLKQHEAHANENKMMLERFTQLNVDPLALMSNVSHQQYNSQSSTNPPSTYGRQNKRHGNNARVADNAIDEDVDEQPVQDLALNMDNVFQADDCDAFDFDVDEAPTAQTMFMANLSSTYPVFDEAGLSYDSDILSEVHDHDHYQDVVCEHYEEHKMHDDVQPTYVVDSHANYTSDSNMIMYDQSVSDTTRNTVVDNSLTAELATYKEQVELYERRARFGLTKREKKIDEQLRIVITDRNIEEENLKKELHSVKMQLASTINHNKSMVDRNIFEELEAEVDQNVVNRKHDKIERKNLLIANDNLIIDCLSKEVFYIATNSELTVSRVTKMHKAHTIVQTCCLELEAELSKLRDKVKKDDH
ncbi:hypothetical protein Tco_0140327 [Tanacetum coccineum]